jgi:hypothetical protein
MNAYVGVVVWKLVVSFTLRPLDPQEKIPHYPLNVSWPQSRYDASEKEKNFLPYRESNHHFPVSQPVAWSLYQLRCPDSIESKNKPKCIEVRNFYNLVINLKVTAKLYLGTL